MCIFTRDYHYKSIKVILALILINITLYYSVNDEENYACKVTNKPIHLFRKNILCIQISSRKNQEKKITKFIEKKKKERKNVKMHQSKKRKKNQNILIFVLDLCNL